MMTKKDFEALATALRPYAVRQPYQACAEMTPNILAALAAFCKTQNPQFDKTRWREFLKEGKSRAPKQRMGDGLKLARMVVDQFGEAIETDDEISGADAVDFLTGELYPEALAIVQDLNNAQEGR